jgi:hypothetical protein
MRSLAFLIGFSLAASAAIIPANRATVWNAGTVRPGIYLCRLTADGKSQTARLLLR